MTTSRSQHRWKDDPLVPIDGRCLQAAIERQGWTIAHLAERLRARRGRGQENPQTLHYLSHREGIARCRQSRRRGLAKVLQVPERWLAGETYGLRLSGTLPAPQEVLLSTPRVMLAVARLIEQCLTACQRDLTEQARRRRGARQIRRDDEVLSFVTGALGYLASVPRWRSYLTTWRLERELAAATSPPTLPAAPRLDREEEAAVLGLVAALECALTPWLRGRAMLNYERFRDLATMLLPGRLMQRPLQRVARGYDPMSPHALVVAPSDGPSTDGPTRRDTNKGRRG
jgi:hypothetical protein